jgi:iron complex transport system ATP-binding protein
MSFEARNLTVRYRPSAPPALDRVSMAVPRGCFYAVLGPNGSGKSTLMRALLGLVTAESGEARFEERPVGEWTRRDLARRVGAVSQRESTAFPISVRDLVEMGRYPHLGPLRPMTRQDRQAVEEALRRCDASELAEREVGTLSGGEFQRVRIARALAQEPSTLMLDEPTASLDVRHEMAILRLLRDAADRGTTVFLVTHHLNLAARFADLALLLDRGHVAAEGVISEVFRRETLEQVYEWPLSVSIDPTTGTPSITPLDPGPANGAPAADDR